MKGDEGGAKAEGAARSEAPRKRRAARARPEREGEGARERGEAGQAPARETTRTTSYLIENGLIIGGWLAGALYVMETANAIITAIMLGAVAALYARTPKGAKRPRRMLGAGAGLLLVGVALVGTGPSELGMGTTLLALLVLAFGIHTYGRLGPEDELLRA